MLLRRSRELHTYLIWIDWEIKIRENVDFTVIVLEAKPWKKSAHVPWVARLKRPGESTASPQIHLRARIKKVLSEGGQHWRFLVGGK